MKIRECITAVSLSCFLLTQTVCAVPYDGSIIEEYQFNDGLMNATELVPALPFPEKAALMPAAQTVIRNSVVLHVDWCNAYRMGERVKLDADNPAVVVRQVESGSIYLPLRFAAEAFGGTVTFVNGQASAELNGITYIPTAPLTEHSRTLVPLTEFASVFRKQVFTSNGLICLSDAPALTADSPYLNNIRTALLAWDSSDVVHPAVPDYQNMMIYADYNPIRSEKASDRLTAIQPYIEMDETAFLEAVRAKLPEYTNIDIHSPLETLGRQLAMQAVAENDEACARRAAIILYELAQYYPDVIKTLSKDDMEHLFGKFIPIVCVYSYDILYNSPVWAQLSAEKGTDVRDTVEQWFRATAVELFNQRNGDWLGNIVPYGLKNVIGLATVLNDPYLIRLFLPWMDRLFSGYSFYADATWFENSPSYHQQTVNNFTPALDLLKNDYKDPVGYTDYKYGLQLDHTDLSPRWPIITAGRNMTKEFVFPNGRPVSINDTHPSYEAETPDLPISASNLHNHEYYHAGNFALTHGDTTDAQQAHLTIPVIAEGIPYAGGHYHGSFLQLQYWSSGKEALPDPGYPHNANRYFNMDVYSHNVPWVWNKDTSDTLSSRAAESTRQQLLAYDDGTFSNKAVQLIDAACPGPRGDKVDMKNRMLMMVETEGNQSYLIDLIRLKGGQSHENYLKQFEDEDCTLDTSAATTSYTGTLQQYMESIGKTQGRSQYRNMMQNPQIADASQPFTYRWTGKDTGVTLISHQNGVPDGEAFFVTVPTFRRTRDIKANQNDYPGWELIRRRVVTPDDITKYAAVYETTKPGETAAVSQVEWMDTGDSSYGAVIHGDTFTDTFYSAYDATPRMVNGFTFACSYALVRQNTAGKVVSAYVFGNGQVTHGGTLLAEGKPETVYQVTQAEGSISTPASNRLTVEGNTANAAALSGSWGYLQFGNQSGWGLKISDAQNQTISVAQHPAFSVTEQGAQLLFFPSYQYGTACYPKLYLTSTIANEAGKKDAATRRPRQIKGDVTFRVTGSAYTVFP